MDRFVKNKRKVKTKPFFFFCQVLRKNHNWPDLDSKNVSNLMLKSSWAPQDRVSIQRRSKCFMSRYLAEHITGTHVSSICHKSASPPPHTHLPLRSSCSIKRIISVVVRNVEIIRISRVYFGGLEPGGKLALTSRNAQKSLKDDPCASREMKKNERNPIMTHNSGMFCFLRWGGGVGQIPWVSEWKALSSEER